MLSIAALFSILPADEGLAAEIGSSPSRKVSYERDCYLRGEIKRGDEIKLRNLLTQGTNRGCTLYLDSIGGLFSEALKLVDLVLKTETPTYVSKGAVCYSACALVFMGGRRTGEGEYAEADRNMEIGAKIGFHRPYIDLPPQDSLIEQSLISNSYNNAVYQIVGLIELADKAIRGETYERILPTELLLRMLRKQADEIYEIKKVEDLILSGIILAPIGNKIRYYENSKGTPIIVGSSARNVCNNFNWLQGRYGRDDYFEYDNNEISRNGVHVQVDGERGERFDGYNGLEGTTQSCYVIDSGASYKVRFDGSYDEVFSYVPKIFGLPRDQAISSIRITYQPHGTESQSDQSVQLAAPAEHTCAVIRNNQVIDNDPCTLIDQVISRGKRTKIFEWPSGAKTSVTIVGKKLSINGTSASRIEYSNGFTCAQNTKTHNYFCVKPWK